MTVPAPVQDFWHAFLASAGPGRDGRFYEAFHFDDNAPTADALAQLVLAGTKRATAGEGEGDGSLAWWRRVHTDYFSRECRRIGRRFTEQVPVVCEQFALVFRR